MLSLKKLLYITCQVTLPAQGGKPAVCHHSLLKLGPPGKMLISDPKTGRSLGHHLVKHLLSTDAEAEAQQARGSSPPPDWIQYCLYSSLPPRPWISWQEVLDSYWDVTFLKVVTIFSALAAYLESIWWKSLKIKKKEPPSGASLDIHTVFQQAARSYSRTKLCFRMRMSVARQKGLITYVNNSGRAFFPR